MIRALWDRLLYARTTFVVIVLATIFYRIVSGTAIGDVIPPPYFVLIMLTGIVTASLSVGTEGGDA